MGRRSLQSLMPAAIVVCAIASPAAAREEVRYRSLASGASGLAEACGAASIESTPQLAVAPGNPRRLSGVYLVHGTAAAVGIRSSDGGRTWDRVAVADATACSGGPSERRFLVNPYVAAGARGESWFGNSWGGTDGGLFDFGVLSHRLTPGAPGWDAAVPLDGERPGQDAAVAADPARPGSARFVWTRIDQVPNPVTYAPPDDRLMTSTTSDGGRTFGDPVLLDEAPPGELNDNPALVRAPDGSLVVTVSRATAGDLVQLLTGFVTGSFEATLRMDALRSDDDGATWRLTRGVADRALFDVADPESEATAVNGLADTAVGADGSIVVATVPRGNTIALSRSTDSGRTWSPPTASVRLDSQPLGAAVAVREDGQLGLLWYDFRSDRPGDDAWSIDAWFASSSDGGRSWEETHVAGPMDLRDAAEPGVGYDGGPLGVFQDLVALPDGFGAIFTVTRPVAQEGRSDVMFARLGSRRLRVTVRPRVVRAGRRTRLRVRVADGEGRPLSGAAVRLGSRSARTDSSGRAALRVRVARPGLRRLRVRHDERRARVAIRVR